MSKKLVHGVIIGLLSAATALTLHFAGQLDWLENKTWDWRVKHMARPGVGTDQVCLVLIDQKSLDWADDTLKAPWPWPRQMYYPILTACRKGGAKAFAFDLIFTEPSTYNATLESSDDDNVLANAMASMSNMVSAVVLSRNETSQTKWPDHLDMNNFAVPGLNEYENPGSIMIPYASFPVDRVATNSDLLGAVFAVQDEDAIIRRAPAFYVFDNHFIPSLGLAAYIATEPEAAIKLENNNLKIGRHNVPLNKKNGTSILNFRGAAQTHKAVNAAAVMRAGIQILEGKTPDMNLTIFRDRYVLLGVSAPGFKDLRPTPLQRDYPGVEIHATMLDNLLSSDFIKDASIAYALLFTICLSLIAAITVRGTTKGIYASIAAVILLATPMVTGFMAYTINYWMPMAVQITGVFFAASTAVIVNYAFEGQQKRFIKNAFKQYLSPDVIDRLVDNPDHLSLGGEKRVLSILFSDVQGFTSISETLEPEELTALLNDYLTAMTDIIMAEGGTIDKYEGDAIIAFWNAPLDINDHAKRAVRAGLECQEKLAKLRPEFKERIGRDIYARIGINTGPVVVGNMGSTQRFDYTFLGDAGNLASRLEGINKQFGTYLMISQYTLDQLEGEFDARELSRVRVVGRAQPVTIYEPMLKKDDPERAKMIKVFTDGLHNYYDGKFKEAVDIFERIAEQDPPAKAYAAKCRGLISNPPEEWNGVWVMTEK